MNDLKIGLIGTGGRGNIARHAHKPGQGFRITAGADINDKALSEFKEKYGPDVFITKDYRDLINRSGIDAVFITSPDFLHEEQAVAALEKGLSVYCEKPLAITIKGCDRIIRTAKKHKAKIFVGHNMRYMNAVIKMKELIDSGAIGEIKACWCRHFVAYGGDAYFRDWHAEKKYSTGLLLQKGAHDIDVIHWLCGAYSERVTGFGSLSVYNKCPRRKISDPYEKVGCSRNENWPPLEMKDMNPVIEVEDQNMMLMRLTNGIMASYLQCHFTPDSWRNYTFIGTKGRLENIGDAGGDAVIRIWNKRGHYNADGNDAVIVKAANEENGGADPVIVNDFLHFIREGGKTSATAVAARNSVAAGYQATMSIRSGGKPLNVPPIDPDLEDYINSLQIG
ncbi:MAG TPA: oxidoreductase [Spirochaetia bacterium]|nr:oxidoreductase [Spirochaetia bacterium]